MAPKRRLQPSDSTSKRTRVAARGTVPSTSTPTSPPTSLRRSPRRALAAASQATCSQHPEPTFELQFLESQPEAEIAPPAEGSGAGTIAITEDGDSNEIISTADDFEGIKWERLHGYIKPLATQRRKKSWIFKHGYRVAELKDPSQLWFICKYCHLHKRIDAGRSGMFNVTKATSSAASHLKQRIPGHNLTEDGVREPIRASGQRSLRQAFEAGVIIDQGVANAMGNFNVQHFRRAVILWLVENNHPLRELETPAFREMITAINPEAERSLWASHTSAATFVMRLFQHLKPQVVTALSTAISKIHISFDGWTTKGGKRGFFGVVAHFADNSGTIRDLPIALPQLARAHTGEAIAQAITQTLEAYSITYSQLGYFVLDNAKSNDAAITIIASNYSFEPAHRRLRCSCHTLNLVGQKLIFGTNKDAYENAEEHYTQEEQYMQEWRKNGPLGVLIDVINYIKTPQQYKLFYECQERVNTGLAADERTCILEPVKPVVTRWNSYCAAFARAIKLPATFSLYAEHHISKIATADTLAERRHTKPPDAPSWMRSTGLQAADWITITEYQDCLEPLKLATKRLEGRGKAGKFGAIYEIIPVFEFVLKQLEARKTYLSQVNFAAHREAPEDHLLVNINAAWSKANDYYSKLDDSPAYYAATCLHPYYKYYCENSWVDEPDWLNRASRGFQRLWAEYKPHRPRSPQAIAVRTSSIDDAIAALIYRGGAPEAPEDEYEQWRSREPVWTQEENEADGDPVKYWIRMRPKYPNLAQFAIDILTIPASSSDCERLFSELGDLLEPKRRQIGSEQLAALQLVRSWVKAGFKTPYSSDEIELTDEQIVQDYHMDEWDSLLP